MDCPVVQLVLGTTVLFKLLVEPQYLLTKRVRTFLRVASSVVLAVSRSILTLVSKCESTTSSGSTDDKIAIIQYKPATSLDGNDTLAHYSHIATIKYPWLVCVQL